MKSAHQRTAEIFEGSEPSASAELFVQERIELAHMQKQKSQFFSRAETLLLDSIKKRAGYLIEMGVTGRTWEMPTAEAT